MDPRPSPQTHVRRRSKGRNVVRSVHYDKHRKISIPVVPSQSHPQLFTDWVNYPLISFVDRSSGSVRPGSTPTLTPDRLGSVLPKGGGTGEETSRPEPLRPPTDLLLLGNDSPLRVQDRGSLSPPQFFSVSRVPTMVRVTSVLRGKVNRVWKGGILRRGPGSTRSLLGEAGGSEYLYLSYP